MATKKIEHHPLAMFDPRILLDYANAKHLLSDNPMEIATWKIVVTYARNKIENQKVIVGISRQLEKK